MSASTPLPQDLPQDPSRDSSEDPSRGASQDVPMTEAPAGAAEGAAKSRAPQALVVPMRRALRAFVIAGLVSVPAAVALGALLGGASGAWGAGIGIVLALVFLGLSIGVALATATMEPAQLGAWVMGSWLVKIVGLIAILAVLQGQDFYSRPALFFALLGGVIASLLLEARVVTRTRVPYVEPRG